MLCTRASYRSTLNFGVHRQLGETGGRGWKHTPTSHTGLLPRVRRRQPILVVSTFQAVCSPSAVAEGHPHLVSRLYFSVCVPWARRTTLPSLMGPPPARLPGGMFAMPPPTIAGVQRGTSLAF